MWQIISDGLSILNENKLLIIAAISLLSLGCSTNFFLFGDLTKREVALKRNFSFFLLLLFFIFSTLTRLAYLKNIFVPPYFDSVEHLRIVKIMVEGYNSSAILDTLPNLTQNYYHLGFHFFASLLTFGLRADPINVILIFGQIILATIPIPIFFLIRRKTQNNIAAFFALLLAGFGWYMPGFAVNWGKYPALAGLLAFEMVLSLAYAISRKKTTRNKSILIIFLILGILTSTFIHSRTLIILFISFLSWFFAKRIDNFPKVNQRSILRIQLWGILLFGILIQADALLKLTLEPYLDKGILITAIILILSPFALKKFPQGLYFSTFFILSLFACLFIPANGILPGFTNQTLLDRPFVEMVLYFPLSILGGLGLAGLLESLDDLKFLPKQIHLFTRALIIFLFIGVIGFFSIRSYNFYPSDCCNFLGYDDTVIFDWMDKTLPTDALILVASNQLNVVPSSTSADFVGSDAGIWIPQLIGREITLMPYHFDFLSDEKIKQLCQKEIDYIYIGNTNQSFNSRQLDKKTEWYKKILVLEKAQLYQLKACGSYGEILP